jgi:hypothetical protein
MMFPDANEGYSVRMIFAASSADASLELTSGSTTGTDAFTAGAAQVETATIVAAAGATSNGNLALVVTAAGMTGSPLTVNVALTTTAHTTAALIAAACRETLTANTAVAALYTVGGSSAAITLTRKPTSTFTVPGGTLNLYPANDSTLNLLIPTALGVTGASSSTNTTAGVASAGVKLYNNGLDFEGNATSVISPLSAVLIKCQLGTVDIGDSGISAGGIILHANSTLTPTIPNPLLLTATEGATDITITVIGQTA